MPNTSKRGFASMDNEKQRTIASKGGKAAHTKGTAHEWSSEEARAAGRKGGESRGTRTRTLEMKSANAPSGIITEPNWVADSGSSLRSANEYGKNPAAIVPISGRYPNAIPVGQDTSSAVARANAPVAAESRLNKFAQ